MPCWLMNGTLTRPSPSPAFASTIIHARPQTGRAAETRVALVQRSCGYAERPTLALAEIAEAVRIVRAASPHCLVLVDNCYGEFTEEGEPCSVNLLHKRSAVTCLVPAGGWLVGLLCCTMIPGSTETRSPCLHCHSISQGIQSIHLPLLLLCMSAIRLWTGVSLVTRRLQVGADLCMGSLIKSPGGTLATTGGYIAGRTELVAAAGARLTAPGVGLDAGAVPSETLRLMYQGAVPRLLRRWNSALAAVSLSSAGCVVERLEAGRLTCRAGLFLAPQMVGEALKGGRLLAAVAARCGIAALPPHGPLEQLGAPLDSRNSTACSTKWSTCSER